MKMFKKLFLISFFLLNLVCIIYPSKKENNKLFDYCYSLEKILSRNLIEGRKDASYKVKSVSKDIAKFGISKTRGALVNKMIEQYKSSKNSQIIKLFPNNSYCYAGYWIENIIPGTFESIFYEKSKKSIDEFKSFKNEVDGFLNDFNSEYKVIKKEINNLF